MYKKCATSELSDPKFPKLLQLHKKQVEFVTQRTPFFNLSSTIDSAVVIDADR